jgi:hypothetical protein
MEWARLIFQRAGNAKPKTTIFEWEYKNMQTNSGSTKVSDVASKVIDKIMMATGIIAYVWILAFLLVGMIAKYAIMVPVTVFFQKPITYT